MPLPAVELLVKQGSATISSRTGAAVLHKGTGACGRRIEELRATSGHGEGTSSSIVGKEVYRFPLWRCRRNELLRDRLRPRY